jgi:S-adenosylhomocysteine hydrolase
MSPVTTGLRAPTLLDRARTLAAEPRTIAGLSPEATAAAEQRLAEQLKPFLLQAAAEKRALRADDLQRLTQTPEGRGLTLDDVLDFLLSPAGAPLQQALEAVSRPERDIPLLPGLDDEAPEPEPWSTPPKDTFEAHLREARRADPFGLSTGMALRRAAVASFAEATGKNGRIDETKLKAQGPVASALYTHIAQKLAGKTAANPTPGQKLIGLDEAVVARVGRGVDLAPIRDRMKAFDVVVDQLVGDRQPLKGMKVVAIQHLLPTFKGVLDALEQAGVARQDMRLIGKSYSTVDEMYAWTVGQGYDVHACSIGGDAASVEQRLTEAAKETLAALFEGIDPKTSKERFLLADDGGKLLYALHRYFPEYAPLCTGFEQTARGIQVLDKMQQEGQPVLCPVVNMARSALKNDSEIPLIGENIVFDSFRYLDELKLPRPQTATVLGFGPVGIETAKALKRRGVDVVVYDPTLVGPGADPQKLALAASLGVTVKARDEALGHGDLVVGCTGRGALDVVEEHGRLKNGAVLVNGASGNHELGTDQFGRRGRWFMEMHFEPSRLMVKDGAASCDFRGQRVALGSGDLGSASMHRVLKAKDTGKEVLVLRSGHVVNLGRDLPPEFIQVTRALVFSSLLQSTTEQKAGVVDVDPAIQALITQAIADDLGPRGLSFATPDFSQLKPWDL